MVSNPGEKIGLYSLFRHLESITLYSLIKNVRVCDFNLGNFSTNQVLFGGKLYYFLNFLDSRNSSCDFSISDLELQIAMIQEICLNSIRITS